MDGIAERYDVPAHHFWLRGPRPDRPVAHDPAAGTWNVYGHAEAAEVLGDPETFSSHTLRLMPSPEEEEFSAAGFLTQLDPPEHGRLRRLVSSAFTRKVVAALEPRIAALTGELLDAARERGRLELVADLAYPLPVTVIAELLGVPAADRGLFRRWADALLWQDTEISLHKSAERRRAELRDTLGPWRELTAYLAAHAAERRRRPRDDLLTRLVEAEVDGERLPDPQVVGFAALLLLAGHVTTTMLLGNTVLCLAAFPDRQAKVRADRSLVPGAIEESLRLLTPFAVLGRATTRPAVVGGTPIPADALVLVWLAAANRDPRRFPDPDTFDPSRTPNPHLAFGHGVHFCLGAPLARLEGRIALNILLDRVDPLRTDPADPVAFLPVRTMTGVRRLALPT
ncbi:MAG: cytochrome P450 [Actinomycetes bacterium]|jgi:hypothetical protein|nr:MAG: cytochrome P450 [Actinomycetota bacterium]